MNWVSSAKLIFCPGTTRNRAINLSSEFFSFNFCFWPVYFGKSFVGVQFWTLRGLGSHLVLFVVPTRQTRMALLMYRPLKVYLRQHKFQVQRVWLLRSDNIELPKNSTFALRILLLLVVEPNEIGLFFFVHFRFCTHKWSPSRFHLGTNFISISDKPYLSRRNWSG